MSKIKGRFYILVPLWGQLLLFEQGALHLKKIYLFIALATLVHEFSLFAAT